MAYRQMNKIEIKLLPQNILFLVLYKLSNNDLCRIRRTCSLINNSVEKWKKRLSSRYALGIPLAIGNVFHDKTELYFKNIRVGAPEMSLDSSNADKHLSAVSIKRIYLHCLPADKTPKAFEFMKKLTDRPVEAVDTQTFPVELVAELADSMIVKEQIRICIFEEVERSLDILKQVDNRSKLLISVSTPDDSEEQLEVYEKVKHFGWVYFFEFNDQSFTNLLWEIHRSPSHENCQIFCLWDPPRRNENQISSTPPMEILWCITDIPMGLAHSCTPILIRKMALGHKCAIIAMEIQQRSEERPNESIYFIDNNPTEVFKKVVECLFIKNINQYLSERYLTSEESTIQRFILCWIYILAEKFVPPFIYEFYK